MLYIVDRIVEDDRGRKWAVVYKDDLIFDVPITDENVKIIFIEEVDDE